LATTILPRNAADTATVDDADNTMLNHILRGISNVSQVMIRLDLLPACRKHVRRLDEEIAKLDRAS
jgi:hypothetical protein